jgi:hypothetical protein
MRHDLPSVSFKIGCRKNCAMKFDCIYNDPETVVSFAAERCHACQYDWPNDPAKVQKFSHNEALRFYATEWDLPDGVQADFWTLLPQSLLEQRRGGCGNNCVSIFCPTTIIAPLGCGTSERNGLARKDVKNLPQAFPLPGHQNVTHLRGAKGGCFGGAAGAKTKSFSIERPISPKTAEKRLLPGPHGPN